MKLPLDCQLISQKQTFQARRDWQEIFKVMKSKDLQPRLLYPARLTFKIEGEIKSFPGKKKLTVFIPLNQKCKKC